MLRLCSAQLHHKRGFLPKNVNLLVHPAGALWHDHEVKVPKELAKNKAHLAFCHAVNEDGSVNTVGSNVGFR